jgi:hypothetical protein
MWQERLWQERLQVKVLRISWRRMWREQLLRHTFTDQMEEMCLLLLLLRKRRQRNLIDLLVSKGLVLSRRLRMMRFFDGHVVRCRM